MDDNLKINPAKVLVKMPNGTFVHMTLEEIKKLTEPIKQFVKEDAASLLSETVPINDSRAHLVSASRDAEVEEAMKKLSFKLSLLGVMILGIDISFITTTVTRS